MMPNRYVCAIFVIKNTKISRQMSRNSWHGLPRRELSKINYHIHTDAIKANLIPAEVTREQAAIRYANKADVLNIAMFGMIAKQWRKQNPDKRATFVIMLVSTNLYASQIWRISMLYSSMTEWRNSNGSSNSIRLLSIK